MIEFFAAIAVFLAAHVLPAATGLRALLIDKMGRPAYLALYSLVSLASIAWVIAAALGAPYVELWAPSRGTALVPLIAMLPACILLAGALWQPSPLSVSFRGGLADPRRAGLVAQVRHPVLWAFFLWAASHLVANGDLVSFILFASLAAFSLAGMKRMERRARARLSEADYAAATAQTAGGPGARLRRVVRLFALIDLLAGVLLYAALLHLHEPVIGLNPLAWL
ncbi:NnrU family protein [Pelagibius marinus]|uniref:NnrU family protein n=1 Tax=Pelagibius marinus TaxID=2762760 RepID=UPI001872E872|nr:NnrU family protein [Pelagibius marinus]